MPEAPRRHHRVQRQQPESGDDLAEALRLIATATRRGLLRLDYGGRIAIAFLAREGGWDQAYARRLVDQLVAGGWLASTRRG